MRRYPRERQSMSSWLSIAARPRVVRRALFYAVVVGTILIGINHGDDLFRGDIDGVRVLKMVLTPLVPYAVSTLSSVGAIRNMERARPPFAADERGGSNGR